MTHLKIGDLAPSINGIDQEGKNISLNQFKGKKLILYFYPKDDTPGCTAEACNLRDNYAELKKNGFEILGISADSVSQHAKFKTKYNLPFPLLADTEKKVLKDYGTWGEKQMYGKTYEGILRTTFIISENGKIEHIFEKVDTKNHTNQIFEALGKK
jgi:thioredoxin-dependent peroxiredoxin